MARKEFDHEANAADTSALEGKLRNALNTGDNELEAQNSKESKKQPSKRGEIVNHRNNEKSDLGITLVKKRIGVGGALDEDKHRKFKALCALQGKTQEEWIEGKIDEAVAHINIKDLL